MKSLEQSYTLNLSQTHEFVFNLSGTPAPKFKWLKDNKELPLKDRIKFISESKDAGVYKVEASNKCSTINCQFTVGVQGEPVFIRKPVDLNIIEKKPFKVDCEVTGIPMPTVEWYKNENRLEQSDNLKIENKNQLNMLNIKVANLEHAGNYKVKATNTCGTIEHNFKIIVEAAPFVIRNLPDKVNVRENEEISIDCEIGGVPPPKVSWSRKGEDILDNEFFKLYEENNKYGLHIKASQADAGLYTLVASNKVGKLTLKTEVLVTG